MPNFEKLEKCPYCSSVSIHFYLTAPDRLGRQPGEFSVFLCRRCGLVFQNPRVKESEIGSFYSEISYCHPPREKHTRKGLKKFLIEKGLANHFNYPLFKKNPFYFLLTLPLKRVLRVKGFPVFKSQGEVLEIGCGNGEFLEQLKNFGWRVKGIEMSESTSAFAREERGLDIENKRIEECQFHKRRFDVVRMSMVLEHLYNPFQTLQVITSWLKPDGQLIFSIPYFNGFEFRMFKSYCYALHLPNHITFFNKKIIRQYLKKLGYKRVKFYHDYFDRDLVASSQYKYQDTGKLFYKVLAYNKIIRFLAVKPFVFLLSFLNQTSRITVYARKRKDRI